MDRLGLLKGEWCLVGGKCLEFRGLRKSEDWDILVSPFLFESLTQKFPNHLKISKYKTPILVFDDQKIEIFKDLPFLEGQEQKIINQAEVIGSFPCMSLSALIRFKSLMGREKDLRDLQLLQKLIR